MTLLFLLITQANVTVSKNLSVGQKLLAERCPVEVWPKIFVTIDAAVNHLLETSSIYRNGLGKNWNKVFKNAKNRVTIT